MNKIKKTERVRKPRNAITITLSAELHRHLEEERERRGGDRAGIKLAHIAREKLVRQLDCERKGVRC